MEGSIYGLPCTEAGNVRDGRREAQLFCAGPMISFYELLCDLQFAFCTIYYMEAVAGDVVMYYIMINCECKVFASFLGKFNARS